jgi:inorganic pyrophosphatase
MVVATDANSRTTHAADKFGLNAALRVAFSGGAVMGFCVVGLGLAGVAIFLCLMTMGRSDDDIDDDVNSAMYPNNAIVYQWAAESMAGFGFGASSIALFARVTGGVYTKAADVGADLVGKVEQGIPEDDPRNPAVIADNVGDNVGDVAGMGADLFESFVGSIIAAITLSNGDVSMIALPFWLAGFGVFSSFIGFWFVSTKEGASQKDLLHALHKAVHSASILVILSSALICYLLFSDRQSDGWRLFGCIVIGLFCGVLIGELTEYFTSFSYRPVVSITDAGATGPATVIIQGLGVGMISTVGPIFVIVVTILSCNSLGGEYGVAIAAVGMLSTLAVTLATDAYGPVADNAGGIAEMAALDERVRQITDDLDALGNTTAATGKGFAIGSAVLTAISLLSAFETQAEIEGLINMGDPVVFSGMLFGAMLPYLFAALTMLSVRKAAGAIIEEVRRQFHTIEGLMEGTADPDSEKCVEICTVSSIQEMVLPGTYAILSPIFVGFTVGPRCLAGLLGGSIASGAMLAIMMSTAGGAWDNSKKFIEIMGSHGGKGTETHKACVVGDTVGDPFKDTSGPALNILIKLMSIISLTIAPMIAGGKDWDNWYYGLLPVALGLFISIYCYYAYWSTDITYKDYNGEDKTNAEKGSLLNSEEDSGL